MENSILRWKNLYFKESVYNKLCARLFYLLATLFGFQKSINSQYVKSILQKKNISSKSQKATDTKALPTTTSISLSRTPFSRIEP